MPVVPVIGRAIVGECPDGIVGVGDVDVAGGTKDRIGEPIAAVGSEGVEILVLAANIERAVTTDGGGAERLGVGIERPEQLAVGVKGVYGAIFTGNVNAPVFAEGNTGGNRPVGIKGPLDTAELGGIDSVLNSGVLAGYSARDRVGPTGQR